MSKYIQLGEHHFELPPAPLTQDEVLFVKENKENQYWRRQTDFPRYFFDWDAETKMYADITRYASNGTLVSLNREDTKEFFRLREREMARRRYGVWMMNYGELTYLTGGHYFLLQWGQLSSFINKDDGSSYGYYREFQRDIAYFLQLCKQDDQCAGGYIIKPKKTGVTQYLAIDMLDESTRYRGRLFGMMSKSQNEARDINFGYYKHAYANLPTCMKPTLAIELQLNWTFGKPEGNKRAKKGEKVTGNADYLNTRVLAAPTVDNAFDGGKYFRAWTDEFPKLIDPYPQDVFKKSVPAVKMQEEITGKYWITSYIPEDDDRSFKEAKKIYYDSKLKSRSELTGRTKSEMYVHFISVIDSAEGSFDRFGKADRKKNMIYVTNHLKAKEGDAQAIQEFKRQNPVVEDDCWREGGGGGSVFDNLRLSEQEMLLDDKARTADLPYWEGNMRWQGERLKSPVLFIPLTEEEKMKGAIGRWKIYKPEWIKHNSFNQTILNDIKKNGKLAPPEFPDYIGAIDPTDYKMKKDAIKGSNNAFWVMSMPDPALNALHNTNASDRPLCEYLYRQEKPSDTFEDALLTMFFFSCPMVIEANKGWLATLFIENDLENFLLMRDKTKAIVPYNNSDEHQRLITTTAGNGNSVVADLVREGQEYLAPPVGDAFDNISNIYSKPLIKDLMSFDTEDTKKYDSAMAFLYCNLAKVCYISYLLRKKKEKDQHDKGAIRAMASSLLNG